MCDIRVFAYTNTMQAESPLCRLQHHSALLWRIQLPHVAEIHRCSHKLQCNSCLHCEVIPTLYHVQSSLGQQTQCCKISLLWGWISDSTNVKRHTKVHEYAGWSRCTAAAHSMTRFWKRMSKCMLCWLSQLLCALLLPKCWTRLYTPLFRTSNTSIHHHTLLFTCWDTPAHDDDCFLCYKGMWWQVTYMIGAHSLQNNLLLTRPNCSNSQQ